MFVRECGCHTTVKLVPFYVLDLVVTKKYKKMDDIFAKITVNNVLH